MSAERRSDRYRTAWESARRGRRSWRQRAEAAEAALATQNAENDRLDQHWADLACRTNERDQWREEARRMHQNCDHWRKRAEAAEAALATQNAENDRLDQLLIDERAITARLGRELAQLQHNISAAHQHLNEIATERDAAIERAEAAEARLRDQNGEQT